MSAVAPRGPGLRLLTGAALTCGEGLGVRPGAVQDDTKLGGLSIRRRIRLSYERNLDYFVDRSDRNKMTFNSVECKVMQSFKCGDW